MITHVGRILGIPSVILNEDDTEIVPLMGHLGFRFADHIVAPESCNLGPYEHKKVAYAGVQELSYLHPDRFSPDPAVVRGYGLEPDGYALLRLARLSAHHDWGKRGIDDDLARKVVDRIGDRLDVYISSERALPTDLLPYRLPIEPTDIHHVLGHALCLVADSQTMTIEAAVLGTPAIRYSDFVGRIGCVEELERRYQLTIGIKPDHPELLLDTVEKILFEEDVASTWQERRQRLLDETIDVGQFLVTLLRELGSGRFSRTSRRAQP